MFSSHSDHRLLPLLSPSRSIRVETSRERSACGSENRRNSDNADALAQALGLVPDSILHYASRSPLSPAAASADYDDLSAGLSSMLLSNPVYSNQRPATAPTAAPDANYTRGVQSSDRNSVFRGPAEAAIVGQATSAAPVSANGLSTSMAHSPTRRRSQTERNVQRLRNESRELILQLINENRTPSLVCSSTLPSASYSSQGHPTLAQGTRTVPTMCDLHYLQTYDLRNNFYLNLVTWSQKKNKIAVAVKEKAYWWDGLRYVAPINLYGNHKPILVISCGPTSVLAVGFQDRDQCQLCLYLDGDRRVVFPHYCAFQCVVWFDQKPWLATGDMFGRIYILEYSETNITVRAEWKGFDQQVCGISLNADCTQIAVGANENMALVWNISQIASCPIPTLLCELHHTLAVKGIDFCPWAPNLLATGGGSNDRHLRFWHTGTGTLLRELNTHKQITSIRWSMSQRELALTFGFDDEIPNSLVAIYRYPSLEVTARAFAKDRRALSAEVSPDQSKIAVATSDGTVRLYQLWERKNTVLRASMSGASLFSSPIIDMIEGLSVQAGTLR